MNQVGDRVELIRCTDEFTQIEPGTQGVVTYVDTGTKVVTVQFDNGITLGLIPGVDRWRTLPKVAS